MPQDKNFEEQLRAMLEAQKRAKPQPPTVSKPPEPPKPLDYPEVKSITDAYLAAIGVEQTLRTYGNIVFKGEDISVERIHSHCELREHGEGSIPWTRSERWEIPGSRGGDTSMITGGSSGYHDVTSYHPPEYRHEGVISGYLLACKDLGIFAGFLGQDTLQPGDFRRGWGKPTYDNYIEFYPITTPNSHSFRYSFGVEHSYLGKRYPNLKDLEAQGLASVMQATSQSMSMSSINDSSIIERAKSGLPNMLLNLTQSYKFGERR